MAFEADCGVSTVLGELRVASTIRPLLRCIAEPPGRE